MGLVLESKEHFLTSGKNLIKVGHSRKSSSICPECSGNESKKREKKLETLNEGIVSPRKALVSQYW